MSWKNKTLSSRGAKKGRVWVRVRGHVMRSQTKEAESVL